MSVDLTGRVRSLLLDRIRTVMLTVGVLAAVVVVGTRLVDEGEIVEVITVDALGRDHVTELWIVDLPSGTYLRAGSPDVEWLARIRETPQILLERGDQELRYRAIPEESEPIAQQVNRAMGEKYGFADRIWAVVSDRAFAVPIRLLPSGRSVAAP
jgi:hypothetical protein